MSDLRYGKRNVAKMIRQVDALRQSIRTEGTPDIQTAWDAVEEHIDFAYRALPAVQPAHVNETPKSEHDAAVMLTPAPARKPKTARGG